MTKYRIATHIGSLSGERYYGVQVWRWWFPVWQWCVSYMKSREYADEWLTLRGRTYEVGNETNLAAVQAENTRLRAFRDAVVGWREFDHPEGFSRFTAEWLVQNADARAAGVC